MSDQTALYTESKPRPKVIISSSTVIGEITSFVTWWYIEMPTWYMGLLRRIAILCDDTLSISILAKTFFVPFHRDSSWVGRGFGIAIRTVYLPMALFVTAIILLICLLLILIWALLPLISAYSLLRSPFT